MFTINVVPWRGWLECKTTRLEVVVSHPTVFNFVIVDIVAWFTAWLSNYEWNQAWHTPSQFHFYIENDMHLSVHVSFNDLILTYYTVFTPEVFCDQGISEDARSSGNSMYKLCNGGSHYQIALACYYTLQFWTILPVFFIPVLQRTNRQIFVGSYMYLYFSHQNDITLLLQCQRSKYPS